ncbi:hypothetical protein ABZW18_31500 [Streptomyces sp. NPDC004647]|uniref:hypothetical protein n=1 Tax=Streptomyces sp. NPDC004647 TaxID=3154671 RepID=UPI0033ABA5FC
MSVLHALALAVYLVSVAAVVAGRCRFPAFYGGIAITCALCTLDALRTGDTATAVTTGAVCAWCAYLWWHGGGGDGTRRRLRTWRSRFHAVRRTAPAT